MKILVTGANGFLGSWLTRALCEQGHKVRVLVRKTNEDTELNQLKVELAQGDVTVPASLEQALRDIEVVFHLAGVVGYSKAQRPLMEQVNVQGTHNMLEASLTAGVKRFVHVSSVVAIGASFDGKVPLNEESSYNLGHLNLSYFETKRRGENLVVQAVRERGLDAVIVNPSTVYGPGDAKKGSRNIQVKVARGQFPFYTSGGASIVGVHDVVKGILSAFANGRTGERYILSGENLTVKKLFQMIAEEAGVQQPWIYLPNPLVHAIGLSGDCLQKIGRKGPLNSENAATSTLFHWFDHTKATRELNFQPRPAREALRESVGWMRQEGLI